MNKSIIKPRAKLTACECDMTEEQLAKLTQVLELARITEQKAKELAEFTLEIDRKYEQRLAQLRLARKLQL